MTNLLYNSGIYCLTSPSGKRYIGQSIDLKRRFQSYKSNCSKSQRHIHGAIKKYGWANFTITVLAYASDIAELNRLEIDFIKLYKAIDPKHGYNLRSGGEGGGKASIETRAKMSADRKGRKLSSETREKLSKAHKGRAPSRAAIEKSRQLNTGKPLSPEHREKISAALAGKKREPHSKETKEKLRQASLKQINSNEYRARLERMLAITPKSVDQFTLDGTFIANYTGIQEAAKATGAMASGICLCCKDKQKSSGGFKWKYNLDIESEPASTPTTKKGSDYEEINTMAAISVDWLSDGTF